MNIQQQSDIPTDIKSTQLLNPAAKPIQGFCVCACDGDGSSFQRLTIRSGYITHQRRKVRKRNREKDEEGIQKMLVDKVFFFLNVYLNTAEKRRGSL